MRVRIITEDNTAQGVRIDCTPTEYMTIKIALQHLANISVNDVEFAKKVINEEMVFTSD